MFAAVSQSLHIGVIFAGNLEISLILSYDAFSINIGLNNFRFLSIIGAIIFALATGSLKFSFLGDSFLSILWVLDHFSSETLSACSVSATFHDDWLSCI
jgi:hypothetical protein